MTDSARPVARPLSPHLGIYHFYITMAMSILHRITGGALYFGTLLLAWWLVAAASGPKAFSIVSAVMGSWFGLLVMFGFTWALIHHLLGGLRHLIWDVGAGFGKKERDALAWANIIGSVGLTLIVWILVFALR